jgi:protein gp37
MNKTKIDWCDFTWNPVTGCLHGCEYCYARKVTERFGKPVNNACILHFNDDDKSIRWIPEKIHGNPYPNGFEPTYLPFRLDEPAQKKNPGTIFVCSMADLFGEWVPDQIIRQVLQAARNAPWHRYLFLTKNPARYETIPPEWFVGIDAWIGTTVTSNADLRLGSSRIEALSDTWKAGLNWFVSVEPLLEEMDETSLEQIGCMDWVIIGAESGTRPEKVVPEKGWIDAIAAKCAECGVPVFMKQSVKEIMGEDFRQEWPWETGEEA